MKKIIIDTITFYQTYLSFGNGLFAIFAPGITCKYDVSCSEYTKQKIKQIGIIKGIWLGIIRVISCR